MRAVHQMQEVAQQAELASPIEICRSAGSQSKGGLSDQPSVSILAEAEKSQRLEGERQAVRSRLFERIVAVAVAVAVFVAAAAADTGVGTAGFAGPVSAGPA
mmetsp:Transcript_30714/g.80282  ORF Transcript_30714/g.80282 Transcript_30714/m.80282 type:complete len:102 (-) Transcript_30714:229-534(-)